MKDLLLSDFRVFDLIKQENISQVMKWGKQDHSPFEWLAYTTEELGELSKAISEHFYRDGTREDVVKEAIQVVTLSLKIAEMYLNKEPIK